MGKTQTKKDRFNGLKFSSHFIQRTAELNPKKEIPVSQRGFIFYLVTQLNS